MRYVDHHGKPTEAYPLNPNGSPGGLTAVTTADGRFTAIMPHAERVFRNVQMSWSGGDSVGAEPVGAHVRQRASLDRLIAAVRTQGVISRAALFAGSRAHGSAAAVIRRRAQLA